MFSPITNQINPVQLGNVQRTLLVSKEYGRLLGVSEGILKRLLYHYPSHGFIIDRKEASSFIPYTRSINYLEIQIAHIFGAISKQVYGVDCRIEEQSPGVFTAMQIEVGSIPQFLPGNPTPTRMQSPDDELDSEAL